MIVGENGGYAAFALYHALHLHFTSKSYDYVKYNGKTNINKDIFMKRKDKYSFYKLSRRYGLMELKDFYIANFVEQSVKWVGDISGIEGEENYKKWQKRNQSLTYTFENDIINLFNTIGDKGPEHLLIVTDGQYPILLNYVMRKNISVESLVVLNDLLNFFPMWERKIEDTYIWPDLKMKCDKYKPFLNYDKDKFKNILKEKTKEYAEA